MLAWYMHDQTISQADQDLIHQLYQVAKVPISIAQAKDRLAKDTIKEISRYGSLEAFVHLHPKYLRIENGLLCTTQSYRASGSNQMMDEMVEYLRRRGNEPQSSMRIFQSMSNRARMDFAITKMRSLTEFASRRPHVFVVNPKDGTISLTNSVFEGNMRAPEKVPQSSPDKGSQGLFPATAPQPQEEVLNIVSLVWRSAPNAYFIPLKKLFGIVCDFEPRLTSAGIGSFLQQLRLLPDRYIDLVSFAGSNVPRAELPDHTYVRLIGTGVALHDTETGDALSVEFEVVQRFTKDLVKYLQPHGEVKMEQLPSLLPAKLMSELPFKGPALMLVFDRLQHMFEVNKASMTVKVTGEAGLGAKELSMPTTPLPRELRAALEILQHCPVKPLDFEAKLSPEFKQNIVAQFGNLPRFVNAHKPELFLKNGMLMTPLIASKDVMTQKGVPMFQDFKLPANEERFAKEDLYDPDEEGHSKPGKGSRVVPSIPVTKMSAKQLADYIYQCIPNDRCVSWMSLRAYVDLSVFQHTLFNTGDPRDFFSTRPDLFSTFDPALTNGFLIAKNHVKQPVGTWGEIEDITTIFKMLAMVCAGGISESAAIQVLPRDARAIIKRCGGFEHLLSQVPQWFEVRNLVGIPGHSICTYIGHLNPNIKQVPSPYPYFIPCIPEHHNVRAPVRPSASPTVNDDVNDPYAEYASEDPPSHP